MVLISKLEIKTEKLNTSLVSSSIKEELLQLILDDKISLDELQDLNKMNQLLRYAKAHHKYPIYHTEKSGYFTTVDDVASPSGKRKIRKSTEKALWSALSSFYDTQRNHDVTFRELYYMWKDWRTTPNNTENMKRIEASWKAYYENEPLSSQLLVTRVDRLTSLFLRNWAESLMKKHNPDKKKFSRMFTIINQCYEFACDEDRMIATENIWQRARKKLNKDLFQKKALSTDSSQVFTNEEIALLEHEIYEELHHPHQWNNSVSGLQILFLLQTGLRIGECCGLKWSDINGNLLSITRQATNHQVKDFTKTPTSCRTIFLTPKALNILEDVKAYNESHGLSGEWIFLNINNCRLGYAAAGRKLNALCIKLGIEEKSPHKCRKTVISALLDSGELNERTVQRLAGHKDIQTTFKYYSFERRTKSEQILAIEKALTY